MRSQGSDEVRKERNPIIDIRELTKYYGDVVDFESTVDPDIFRIEGVDDLDIDGKRASMIVTRNLDEVIKKLSKQNVVNMSLETFSLDQLFLTYYSRGGKR